MPTFETILLHAPCYTEARMRERAALWPEPDGPESVTWEWFLGERCEQFTRDECIDVLSVAVSYIQREKVALPVTRRALWIGRTDAERAVLLDALAALGVYLDAWDADAGGRDTQSDPYVDLADSLSVYTSQPT